jgi:hypothetical protein
MTGNMLLVTRINRFFKTISLIKKLVHRLLPRASGSKVNSCPLSSHEIDGVRKEKERLTASKLNVQLLSPSKFQSFTGKLDTSLSFLGDGDVTRM